MKIGIVTFHRAYNYGAVLQAYALAKVINNSKADCKLLDYWPERFKHQYCIKERFCIKRPPVKTWLRRLSVLKTLNKRTKRFERFIYENIPLNERIYYSPKDLVNKQLDFDLYITGSDQVWHNEWADFDPVFFLDFPDAKSKDKYSYAASFGFTRLPEGLFSEYKRRLKGYKGYSVREESGKEIIKDLTGEDAVVSCDPTLLLPASHWESLCLSDKEIEPYILVYYTVASKELQKKAQELREKTGYKVISLPCNMSRKIFNGDFDKPYNFDVRSDSGPKEFLTLVKNASYVLTNSFHGTVFSIIFHKSFLTQLTSDEGKVNNRVLELFDKLEIKNHNLIDDFNSIDQEVNWDIVDANLSKLTQNSVDYLRNIISSK